MVAAPPKSKVWISVGAVDLDTGKVRGEPAFLRAGPGVLSPAVGQAPRGMRVDVSDRLGLWLRIESPPACVIGYVRALQTRKADPEPRQQEMARVSSATPAVGSDEPAARVVHAPARPTPVDAPVQDVATAHAGTASKPTILAEPPLLPSALPGVGIRQPVAAAASAVATRPSPSMPLAREQEMATPAMAEPSRRPTGVAAPVPVATAPFAVPVEQAPTTARAPASKGPAPRVAARTDAGPPGSHPEGASAMDPTPTNAGSHASATKAATRVASGPRDGGPPHPLPSG